MRINVKVQTQNAVWAKSGLAPSSNVLAGLVDKYGQRLLFRLYQRAFKKNLYRIFAYAYYRIQLGTADIMIAGGAEKASSELGMAGFAAARALSTRNDDPQAASRPWDRDRDGFVLSDGAGMVVLARC